MLGVQYNIMKSFFPAQNREYTYFQGNRSDDLGSIWSSFNLDFQSNLGTMRVAPRLKMSTSTDDIATFNGAPQAFEYFGSKFWTISNQRIFQGGATPNVAFIADTSTNTQVTYSSGSDLELFNGQLFSTTDTGLFSLNAGTGGTWTDRSMTLTSSVSHMMAYFKRFNRLYVLKDGDNVHSIDTSYTVATSGDYTLNLNSAGEFRMLCMKASSNTIWIGAGAVLNRNGRGRIYEWDGVSAQVTNEYIIEANSCVAIIIDNDIPYAMDSNGILLRFNGSTFEEIGRLPNNRLDSTSIYSISGFIHPNGLLATRNNTILALIDNENTDADATIEENLPSGVWEFDLNFGVTHKYSISYNPVASTTITDYGQNRIVRAGALANADGASQDADRNGTIILGASFYKDASSTSTAAVFINDSNNTVQKKGYFVTTWFNSSEIQDKWTRLWTTYRKFLDTDDSIIFKYRIYEEDPVYATITWVNTTSFTTTTDITAYGPTASGFNGTVGGEVEIIQGTGGGSCVHITNIVNNAGTYTVTVDNPVTGVTTGTAKARFQKWIKLFPEVTDQVKSYAQLSIHGAYNTRIQIKGCMTFKYNDEFHKMAIWSNEDIKINQ